MKDFYYKLLELLPVIGLAAFGGVTRTVAGKKRGEAYSLRIAIPEIIIAVFSGMLVHLLTADSDMSDNLRSAAIALSGYCARAVMDLISAAFVHIFKKLTM